MCFRGYVLNLNLAVCQILIKGLASETACGVKAQDLWFPEAGQSVPLEVVNEILSARGLTSMLEQNPANPKSATLINP